MLQNLTWLPFALMSVTGIVAYGVAMKISSNSINPFLFSTLINGSAFVLNLLILYFVPTTRTLPLLTNKLSIILGLCCGLAAVCIDVGYFLMMRSSPTGMTIGIPFIGVVNIAIMALMGVLFFHEKILTQHYWGILFAIIAVGLLSYRSPS